jgi:hypothetical protein
VRPDDLAEPLLELGSIGDGRGLDEGESLGLSGLKIDGVSDGGVGRVLPDDLVELVGSELSEASDEEEGGRRGRGSVVAEGAISASGSRRAKVDSRLTVGDLLSGENVDGVLGVLDRGELDEGVSSRSTHLHGHAESDGIGDPKL